MAFFVVSDGATRWLLVSRLYSGQNSDDQEYNYQYGDAQRTGFVIITATHYFPPVGMWLLSQDDHKFTIQRHWQQPWMT